MALSGMTIPFGIEKLFAENKHKNDFIESTILKTGYYSHCVDIIHICLVISSHTC
jgi:hypothetical protein